MKCPVQDTQHWKPDDIFETQCPNCGSKIEFFKDDASRRCKGCGEKVSNPKLDFGCAQHCEFAEQCLSGVSPEVLKQYRLQSKDKQTHAGQGDPVTHKEKNNGG